MKTSIILPFFLLILPLATHAQVRLNIEGDGLLSGNLTLGQGLQLGNSVTNSAGMLRWTGTDFQGYDGSQWRSLTQTVSVGSSPWLSSGPDIYFDAGNVGVGVNSPIAPLHVGQNQTVLFGADTTGGGTKMLWVPSKGAFRWGTWEDTDLVITLEEKSLEYDSIGIHSFAGGYNPRASGNYSFSGGGKDNKAWGDYSFIGGGFDNTALGTNAVIGGGFGNRTEATETFVGGGFSNTASAANSFVGGGGINIASGERSFVGAGLFNEATNFDAFVGGGTSNDATGESSFIGGGTGNNVSGLKSVIGGGGSNTVSGEFAFDGAGFENNVSGDYAFNGGGYKNTVSGKYASNVGGYQNTASADYALAGGGISNNAGGLGSSISGGYLNVTSANATFIGGGNGLLARSFGEAVFGQYNEDYNPSGIFNYNIADRLFVIGNGTSSSNRANAVTVMKNGNVGLGISTPTALLHLKKPATDARQIIDGQEFSGLSFFTDGAYRSGIGHTTRTNEDWFFVYEGGINSIVSRGGNVGIGTTAPAGRLDVNGEIYRNGALVHSDKRLKRNIQPIRQAIEKLKDINGVSFEFKSGEFAGRRFSPGRRLGLIAQEVEQVFPELVRDRNDGFKAVNYEGLVPVLIEGLKEQQEIIEDLEEEAQKYQDLMLDQQNQIDRQQEQIDALTSALEELLAKTTQDDEGGTYVLPLEQKASLAQNQPNPFHQNTVIQYFIPGNVQHAHLQITTADGKVLGRVTISEKGKGQVIIEANRYPAGTYYYSLVLDGQVWETKPMVLTR